MKHFEDLQSMTYYKEKLFLPFNKNNKTKNSMFYVLNTSVKSISEIFTDLHPILSNTGNIYHTYYYNALDIPKCIKSKRVRNSGLTVSEAKKERIADYNLMKDSADVITPLMLKTPGFNFISDMNPVIRLYQKQKRLESLPLKESITTFFDTINAYVSKDLSPYTNNGIFVNLEDYNKDTAKFHILTYLILLLKRSDKFIQSLHYNFKVLFYSNSGYFTLDASKDLKKSNLTVINKLLKRLRISTILDETVDRIEKVEVQKYLAAKALTKGFDGSVPDENVYSNINPDDIIDADSEIVDKVKNKLDDVDDLEDIEKTSEIDNDLFTDEEMKKKYEEALTKKSTGRKSEASLKRDQMLREKQKDVKVKTKTLGEISNDKVVTTIPTHKVEIDTVTNKNLKEMKFPEFNKAYLDNVYEHDIGNIINSISEDKSIPVHVLDIKVEDTSDELTLKETYTVTLEDENRKRHTLKFALPKVVDNQFIIINGSKKTIQNQFIPFPVIKTGEDEVQICTNYNKIFINRLGNKFSANSEKFRKLLENHPEAIKLAKGCNTSINKEHLTYLEYDEFAKQYNSIEIGKAVFIFNVKTLLEMFPNHKEKLDEYLVGYVKGKPNTPIIYKPKNEGMEDFVTFMVSFSNDDTLKTEYAGYSTGKKFVYTSATVMTKHIPVIVLICYFEGITTVLRKFNDKTVKLVDKVGDKLANNYIKFADGYLEYPKSNMEACMMFNGFTQFATSQYTLADLEDRVTYVDIFDSLFTGGVSIADALINYYDWMIDPITLELLQLLDYPTDLVSLIIFANNMLADSHFTTDIDLNQYRMRNMEIITAILYKNIARSYSRYRRTANNPNPVKISMDENVVIKELVALPTVEDYSELSPMVEVQKQGLVSMKGPNGLNMDRAYNLEKRAYHDSMTGVVGVSTDNASNAGKIKQLVAEPTIMNTRGFMDLNNRKDMDKLNDANLITPVEMLTPMTVTVDDNNRTLMATKQTGHVIPVENNCPALISNGMDQMIHYRTSNDFSVVAKEDGKVLTIDNEKQLMIIQYKSGEKQAIDLSPHVVKNGGGGFYLVNQLKAKVKNGATFKKDTILAYDPKYYKDNDQLGNIITMGSLQKIAVMSNYATFEDSNFITKQMSQSLASNITMPHKVIIGQNSNVDYIVKVGDYVTIGDDLIRYDTSYDDAELNKMLASVRDDVKEDIVNLGKSQVHSHYTGVVSDIDIICTVDPNELSPSLKKIVNKYQKDIKDKKKLMDTYDPDSKDQIYRMGVVMNRSDSIVKSDEYGKVQGEYIGNGVRFIFYVTYHDELSDGDKLAGWTANKNTIGYQIPRGFEPYSEFRPYEEISATQAPSAILQRGTPSIVVTATVYKCLIELKRKIYEIMTGENFDEILKQKQPWMNPDKNVVKESTESLPIMTTRDVSILEEAFELYLDASGKYRSERIIRDGDLILPVSEEKDMSQMIENFELVTDGHNAIMNDDKIIAIDNITPHSKIRLKL